MEQAGPVWLSATGNEKRFVSMSHRTFSKQSVLLFLLHVSFIHVGDIVARSMDKEWLSSTVKHQHLSSLESNQMCQKAFEHIPQSPDSFSLIQFVMNFWAHPVTRDMALYFKKWKYYHQYQMSWKCHLRTNNYFKIRIILLYNQFFLRLNEGVCLLCQLSDI